jgi:hypothetical protein
MLCLKNAAGALAFLSASALPKLSPLADPESKPWDLTEDFVKKIGMAHAGPGSRMRLAACRDW